MTERMRKKSHYTHNVRDNDALQKNQIKNRNEKKRIG